MESLVQLLVPFVVITSLVAGTTLGVVIGIARNLISALNEVRRREAQRTQMVDRLLVRQMERATVPLPPEREGFPGSPACRSISDPWYVEPQDGDAT